MLVHQSEHGVGQPCSVDGEGAAISKLLIAGPSYPGWQQLMNG